VIYAKHEDIDQNCLRRRPDLRAAISPADREVAVRVIRTNEEELIAKTVCQVLGLGCKKKKEN
jgi:hypothetical protein